MKERHLIVLRPNQYNDGDLRLALFTDDYRRFVQGKRVLSLYVKFHTVNRKISSLKTYVNKGSIAKKDIVNNWLFQKGYLEGTLLLFELTIDDKTGIHVYSFLSAATDVTSLINDALATIK